ncbi:MAG: Lhr family helicase, partial [Nocardioidaceae bacterium]
QTLVRLAARGRVLEGEFRPAGSGAEWCDAEVLRRLRRRSLAVLRKQVEPVEPATLGRFLPAWQNVVSTGSSTGPGRRGPSAPMGLRGVDGVLAVVEQLAGCPVPASALEPLVLAGRVVDYSAAMLDELTTAGEVLWAGHGALPGTDGWVSLHPADTAPLTLPEHGPLELTPVHDALIEGLAGGGAYFFPRLVEYADAPEHDVHAALWDLVWAGRLSNDRFAPLRALTGGGRTAHRSRRTSPRARLGRPAERQSARGRAARSMPATAGRWSLLPDLEPDTTRRAHAAAEGLLERHGVVTRGAVAGERVPGGFAAMYKVLSAFEDSGRCRRGYFVATLGAAQFGGPGAVDRLRSYSRDVSAAPSDTRQTLEALVLAATDPANPYGAALPWPDRVTDNPDGSSHRPGRKAGALVVLVDGGLVLYVERGGRTLLTFTDEHDELDPAFGALAEAVRRGALGRLTVERADGAPILGPGERAGTLRRALEDAGFVATPRGLRLRA